MASQNRKKQRRLNYIEPVERIYIFCEGEQTEPLYFGGFVKEIKKNPIYKNTVFIEVIGLAKETLRVVEDAEKYVEQNKIKNANIWCVYDKDSFPEKDFNEAEYKLSRLNKGENKYYAAWSNQCVEYWFILHFDYYIPDNDRSYYRKYLHDKFANIGWGRYQKNNEELFGILLEHGNPKQAIVWAKRRINDFSGCTPSKSAPATKVYELVLALSKYLPEEIKNKFI